MDANRVQGAARSADHFAVLALVREDASVHASLVKAGVVDAGGREWVGLVAAGDALKLRLLRRSPRASATFAANGRWLSVEGPVTLIGPDDGVAPAGTTVARVLRDVFSGAGGEHRDWDAFDRAMAAERRCAVLIDATTVTGNL